MNLSTLQKGEVANEDGIQPRSQAHSELPVGEPGVSAPVTQHPESDGERNGETRRKRQKFKFKCNECLVARKKVT